MTSYQGSRTIYENADGSPADAPEPNRGAAGNAVQEPSTYQTYAPYPMYQQSTMPYLVPYIPRPAPWANPFSIGKISLLFGIANCSLLFLLGYVSFQFITEPYYLQGDLNIRAGIDPYLLMECFSIFLVVYGVCSFIAQGRALVQERVWTAIGMVALPFILSIGGFLIYTVPSMRVVLIVIPLIVAYANIVFMANSYYSGLTPVAKRNVQWLTVIGAALTIAWAVMFEYFINQDRTIGCIITYVCCAAAGLTSLGTGVFVFSMTTRRASVGGVKDAAPQPAQTGTMVVQGPKETSTKPRPRKAGILMAPVWLFIFVALVNIVLFVPPMAKYSSGPVLEIRESHIDTKGINYYVKVANTGGSPAVGIIELWVKNSTNRFIVDQTDRIDGFGEWTSSGKVPIGMCPKSVHCDIELVFKGNVVATHRLTMSSGGDCMIPISFIALASCSAYAVRPRARHIRKQE